MSEETQNPPPDLEELKKACEAEMENVATENEKPQASTQESPAPTKDASTLEIEQLKKDLSEAKDKTLRLMAEFDNYRRRTAKEQLDLIETANAKLLGK
ncbi:MAG: nucleotide exchange factor GrpE, partial [Fibrobacteres bacterium CG2_30_45_31]